MPESPMDPERVFHMPDIDRPVPEVWTSDGTFDSERAQLIAQEAASWPAEQRAAMLTSLRAAEVRATVKTRYANAAQIARAVSPGYVITPAIDLLGKTIERVLCSRQKINLSISMPPQEGKSSLGSVWTPIRALQLNPNRRIILATYADALAEMHSRSARSIIETHGTDVIDARTGMQMPDRIGLKLAKGNAKVSHWSVEGGIGGLLAAGIGSTITGMPADLMIIDDPFKNSMEADSKAHRDKVIEWFSHVALTRLSPEASVILIQTRWHPEDLAGKVLTGEQTLDKSERSWKFLNIPAIAEDGIDDALGRAPGTPMVSARDTPEAKRNFALTRKQVGERAWYALYQGSPRNPAGGIFSRAWFEPRLPAPPTYPVASIVGVDPADSGDGDEAGIIAGMLLPDGRVALTHDRSGHFTSDQWSKAAVLLALEIGAREVAVEAYTTATTYLQVVKRAYRAIHEEAVGKRMRGEPMTPIEQRALADIPPFMVTKWRGANKMDAVARSGGLSQAFETRRAVTVEHALSVFEEQAADWQAGQHQPDRVAAAVIVHDRLAGGGGMHIAPPPTTPGPMGGAPVSRPPAWMTRRIG